MTAFTREPSGRRASTIGRDDLLHYPQNVRVVAEGAVGGQDLPESLDVDLAGAVDHHFRYFVVVQERLDWAEAEDLVHHLTVDSFLDQQKLIAALLAGHVAPIGLPGSCRFVHVLITPIMSF